MIAEKNNRLSGSASFLPGFDLQKVKVPAFPDEIIDLLHNAFGLEELECLSWGTKASGFSLFRGNLGKERLFIKWGGKPGNCLNDYAFTRKVYETNPACVIRPYFCVSEGEIQCLGLQYVEGRTLKTALEENSLTEEEKEVLVRKLPVIAQALIDADCVHRDVKPDNIFILPDGDIRLFDFEFATNASEYAEREEIRRFPHLISVIGTKSECGVRLGIGKFMWDDMVIFRRMLERIGSSERYAEAYARAESFFRSQEGKRHIRFPNRLRIIITFKAIEIVSALLPLRSWKNKVRGLKRKSWF